MKIPTLVSLLALSWTGCQDRVAITSAMTSPAEEVTHGEISPFNRAGSPVVALSIPNMHCESCVAKTTEVLSKQPGVVEVRVDLDTKQATLVIDEDSFDSQNALDVLDDYGFKDSTVLSEEGISGK
jgi:copper chaperone CopZ